MTTKELMALGRLLGGYLELFAGCFSYRPSFEHFGSYARGLLSDLPRKSVEPIALACGTAVRTLQGFLRSAVWDHARVRQIYQQRLAALPRMSEPDDLGTIGLIDETSIAKKGGREEGGRDSGRAAAVLRGAGPAGELHRDGASGAGPRPIPDAGQFGPVPAGELE